MALCWSSIGQEAEILCISRRNIHGGRGEDETSHRTQTNKVLRLINIFLFFQSGYKTGV